MEYADSSDVWNVRFRWATLKPWLQEELLAGRYRFSAATIPDPRGKHRTLGFAGRFGAQGDGDCAESPPGVSLHLLSSGRARRGERGAKAAVRAVCAGMAGNPFVFRTDVKSYYASIDHAFPLARCGKTWTTASFSI